MLISDANRCDALILTADPDQPVIQVPLPDLTAGAVTDQVARFRRSRQSAQDGDASLRTQRNAQQVLLDILAWTWNSITEPVLCALGHTSMPQAHSAHDWPRLWWCPTGALASLPLHAAGHHADVTSGAANPRTVLDRVVSSYAPTIRSLRYRRQRSRVQPAGHQTLIVAPTEIPETMPLDQVATEARMIAGLLPGSTVLDGQAAIRPTVLEALRTSRVVHFACHGVSDWSTPQSSLLRSRTT